MIERSYSFRPRPGPRCHWMGIVKSDQPLTLPVVQGQRITQAVWPFGRRRHALDLEFDPVVSRRIDDKHFAIERKQGIKTRVVRLIHSA